MVHKLKRKYIKWEKLDNTANIFPVIAGENMTNTYRISVVLKESIDPVPLQEALSIVLPKFPGFNLRLRMGVFWYYFEENGKKAPKVKEENSYPCRYIHTNRNNSYMFTVTYYKNRINLEAFHALTDGMGGIGFLREITYQYLRIVHPDIREKLGDELSEETSLDRDDSFVRNYKKANASQYKTRKAFILKGEKLPYGGFGTICGFMSVSQLKEISREKYHTSINNYLIACFIYAVYLAHPGKITEEHPIRIAVPVNLRPYFESNTTKNFFVMISAEFYPKKSEYTFDEIMEITKDSIESQKTKENLEAIFSYNVSNSEILAARAVPLPIKNMAMLYVYNRAAMANTTTITNIGNVKVLPEYENYVDNFYSFLPFSKGQNLKATITSYKDSLVLGFSTRFIDTTVPRLAFKQMTRDGADVSIETNGEFY
jgi:hypothetical protein